MTTCTAYVQVLGADENSGLMGPDEGQARVWVRVPAWSPVRAFSTGARAFAAAAGLPVALLPGLVFAAHLDVGAAPENIGTLGEELRWPGLRLPPQIPIQSRPRAFGPGPVGRRPEPEPVPVLSVTVYGVPAPQGSKRHVGKGRMVESSAKVKPWREAVVWAMRSAIDRQDGWAPLTGPLEASMTFTFVRPKGHYGTGRNAGVLKESAPLRPAVMPDLSKLARSTEDAITTAGGYHDDTLIVGYRRLEKRYVTDHGWAPDVLASQGAVIHLYRVEGGEASCGDESVIDSVAVGRAVACEKPYPVLTEAEKVLAAREMTADGLSAKEIGEVVGASSRTVERWREDFQVPAS